MKQCSTCREEFADKFGFCPVDGTPLMEQTDEQGGQSHLQEDPTDETLSAWSVPTEVHALAGSKYEGAPVPASTALARADEYHLTFVDDTGLTRRLMDELKEVAHHSELTWPEFKRDPFGYSKRFVSGYSLLVWR